MKENKFRAWTGVAMEYNVIVGLFGAFYVKGIDTTDSACLSPMNTKYPETVPIMQYTGLKDRNGVEIYEGDILKCSDGRIVKVVYSEWRFMIESKPYSKMEKRMCESTSVILQGCDRYANLKNTEIIGNAFDNPELLEK